MDRRHWLKFCVLQTYKEKELLRLVYFGGVDASLRKEVWPFLLGHYQFGMSEAKKKEVCQCQDYGIAPQSILYLKLWPLIPHPSPPGRWTGQSVLPTDHAWVARLRGDCPPARKRAACCSVGKVLIWSEHGRFKSEDGPPWLYRQ